jgi:dTDP-4-amino-4,6-dideoxygalactose transaminase
MTEMQAAIGRVQLGKLDKWVARRRQNAARLTDAFQELPGLRVAVPGDDIYHAYYKYYVFARPEELGAGWDRDRIMQEVNARGVPCMNGICPEIYREKAFSNRGQKSKIRGQGEVKGLSDLSDVSGVSDKKNEARGKLKRLPVARELGETSLMFLVHPTLRDEEIDTTCRVMAEVMDEAV